MNIRHNQGMLRVMLRTYAFTRAEQMARSGFDGDGPPIALHRALALPDVPYKSQSVICVSYYQDGSQTTFAQMGCSTRTFGWLHSIHAHLYALPMTSIIAAWMRPFEASTSRVASVYG